MIEYFQEALLMTIESGLFFNEVMHGFFAMFISYLMWRKTKQIKYSVGIFVVAYFIDLDHLIDYFSFYGAQFSLKGFLGGDHFDYTQTAYLPFHAWEWLIPLGIVSRIKGWRSWVTVLFLGVMIHLVYDAISARNILLFSLTNRLINNFIVQ